MSVSAFNHRGVWALYKFEMHRFLRTLGTGMAVPVITTSRGRIEIPSARRIVSRAGEWRAAFDLALTGDIVDPVNLRLFLSLDGQALSETWLYQYTPPPGAQRKV